MLSTSKPAACLPAAFVLGGVAALMLARALAAPAAPLPWVAVALSVAACGLMVAFCVRLVKKSNAEMEVTLERMNTYRDFFEHAPILCHILDAQGRYVEVNETELLRLGRKREEVLGRRPADFEPPTDSQAFDQRWSTFLRQGHLEAEVRFLDKDGRPFDTLLRASVIRGPDGEPKGARATLVDITERKRLLLELEEARAQADRHARELESLFNSVGDGLIFLDRTGRPVRMNRAAEQIAGTPAHKELDLAGWTQAVNFADADGKPIAAEQTPGGRTLMLGETVRDALMRLRNKNGTEVLISATSVPLWSPEGTLVGASIAYRDVTEFERVRRELQQSNEQLRRADRFKTEFLANMSHELRTPLNAVIGFGELLRDKAFGPLNEKQSEYVADILSSARHLLHLINDVLDLTRIEAGRITIQPEKIDLVVPFSEALALVKPQADARKLSLSGQAVPGQIDLYADPVRLRQVLLNLLSNAIKFTPEGGRVELDAEASEGWVTVRVSDTGIGIDSKDFARIFEPFQQVEPTLTRHTAGAGLGLTICKKLVELHGGTIWVESRRGSGSAFCFRVPRDPATFRAHAVVQSP